MDRFRLEELLARVRAGDLTPEAAAERISASGMRDLGFARLDLHRSLRRGMPEVVFAEGKTPEQVEGIVAALLEEDGSVLVTRLDARTGARLAERHPGGRHDAVSRTFACLRREPDRPPIPGLLVVTAGTSDLPVAEEAAVAAECFGLEVDRLTDVGVAGLHRLLDELERLRSARVLVVVAGMEGALPSVVAGLVAAPVIGVPTSVGYGAALGGLTALFGMLTSCSGGLTVVNVDNGFGAACAALSILASTERDQRR